MAKKPTPKPIHSPVSFERKYAARLRRMAKWMGQETISRLQSSDNMADTVSQMSGEYSAMFKTAAPALFKLTLDDIDKSTSRLLAIEPTEQTKLMLATAADENAQLVSSIPQEHFERVRRVLRENPGNMEAIVEAIKKTNAMSDRRAKNLALDQTRKTYQGVAIQKAQSAGASKGIWIHSKGSKKPRHRHLEYHGKEFDLAVGAPVGDNGGNMVQPSEEPNCKCTFKLVFSVEPK